MLNMYTISHIPFMWSLWALVLGFLLSSSGCYRRLPAVGRRTLSVSGSATGNDQGSTFRLDVASGSSSITSKWTCEFHFKYKGKYKFKILNHAYIYIYVCKNCQYHVEMYLRHMILQLSSEDGPQYCEFLKRLHRSRKKNAESVNVYFQI